MLPGCKAIDAAACRWQGRPTQAQPVAALIWQTLELEHHGATMAPCSGTIAQQRNKDELSRSPILISPPCSFSFPLCCEQPFSSIDCLACVYVAYRLDDTAHVVCLKSHQEKSAQGCIGMFQPPACPAVYSQHHLNRPAHPVGRWLAPPLRHSELPPKVSQSSLGQ